MIDTHSHLYTSDFKEDFEDVLERIRLNRVEQILLPNIDSASINDMHQLVNKDPSLFIPMMGLHPCSVNEDSYNDEIAIVEKWLKSDQKYVAIGEIGMDLHWDKTTKSIQEKALIHQLELASEYTLPVALHTRNATQEVIEIIKDRPKLNLSGVFHCFGDGIKEAEQIIELGFSMGIGGVVTFKNSGLDTTLKSIDLKHILLETDSPYLAPVPFRGKRNESSYILHIAQKIAQVKEVALSEVIEETTKNAIKLFKLNEY
jgi:TatD DNase family protein